MKKGTCLPLSDTPQRRGERGGSCAPTLRPLRLGGKQIRRMIMLHCCYLTPNVGNFENLWYSYTV